MPIITWKCIGVNLQLFSHKIKKKAKKKKSLSLSDVNIFKKKSLIIFMKMLPNKALKRKFSLCKLAPLFYFKFQKLNLALLFDSRYITFWKMKKYGQ